MKGIWMMVGVVAAGCAPGVAGGLEPRGAYIRGVVVERTGGDALLVRADAQRAAVVRRGAGTRVRGGTWEGIAAGQRVTVWNSGPETRSLPPQVTADSVVVE